LPVVYDGLRLDVGYRVDVLVEDCVIVELKAVEKLLPVHEAQSLSHLKVSGVHVGLLSISRSSSQRRHQAAGK
jgi:GxxExxY protein